MKNIDDSSIRLSQFVFFKRAVPSVLIPLCAFFAPWGSGLQQVVNLDLSKIFVGLAILLILYWFLFVYHKMRSFPHYFNYFILFVTLHTFITYVLIFPRELKFGYTDEIILQNDFIRLQEAKGMIIARFFLFVLFGYALGYFLRNRKRLMSLSLAYGIGLTSVMILGGYRSFDMYEGVLEMRLSGGFLDPNAFGLSAVTAVFLNIIVIIELGVKKWNKLFSIIFIGVGMLGIFFSGSRTALFGLFVGLLVLLIYSPHTKKKIQIFAGLLMIASAIFLFIPHGVRQTIESRTNLEKILESRATGRLDIWGDYLYKVPDYALKGVGMGRSMEVIRDSWTAKWGVPHNNYLLVWIEFGTLGLIFFIAGLWKMWKRVSCHKIQSKKTIKDATILGLFAAWLSISFFLDNFGLRETWIVLGVVVAYGRWNFKKKEQLLC